MGARKLAIVNVWLVGCVPAVRAFSPVGGCSDTLNQLAAGFDDSLRSLLAGLAPRLPGLVYSLGDAFGFTRDAVADPRTLGYTDVARACCGSGQVPCLPYSTLCADRDQHLFWDRAHPSQRTAFLTAQAFYDGPAKYTTPINFMKLAQSN
jgi:phospholipase/lecithinase/hemolysin